MRILHLILIVFFVALGLAISREPIGRVALIVFVVGLGEFVLGGIALYQLFDAVQDLGQARGLLDHLQAIALTSVVLVSASVIMNGLLWLGFAMVQAAVP